MTNRRVHRHRGALSAGQRHIGRWGPGITDESSGGRATRSWRHNRGGSLVEPIGWRCSPNDAATTPGAGWRPEPVMAISSRGWSTAGLAHPITRSSVTGAMLLRGGDPR